MRDVRAFVALLRHAALLHRTGQLRFRLETFGLYYPVPQYAAPAWRVSWRSLALLARHTRAYGHWLVEMEDLRKGGPSAWWDRQYGPGIGRLGDR